jgi:4-hydroxy-2-oxoheptanedioate aldolase
MHTAGSRLKGKLESGHTVIVANADYPSAALVEFLGRPELGLDAVMIDTEQGSADIESIEQMARAARLTNLCSLVRVFSSEPWVIERLLFRGVDGIVAPRINSADAARSVVDSVRYCFPDDYQSKVIVIQIESAAAYEDLDAFLAVDGIDVFFVGPVDLAKSMGHKGDYSHPEVERAIDDILRRTRSAQKTAGMMVRPSDTRSWDGEGARFLYFHVNDWIRLGARSFPLRRPAPLASET